MTRRAAIVFSILLILSPISTVVAVADSPETRSTELSQSGSHSSDVLQEDSIVSQIESIGATSVLDRSLDQSANISPDSDQTFVEGGIYNAIVSVDVDESGLIDNENVKNPALKLAINTSSGSGASFVSVSRNDYNATADETQTACVTECVIKSDTSFEAGKTYTTLVQFYIDKSEAPDSVTINATPGAGDGSGEITYEATVEKEYSVTESTDTTASMASVAEAKAELASGYNETYDRLLYQEDWDKRYKRSMSEAFTVVANDAAKSIVTGYADDALAGVSSLKNAQNLETLQNARTAYGMSQNTFGGGTVGEIARINQELYLDLQDRIATDSVQYAGNSSYPLQELHRLSKAEAAAWRTGDRQKVKTILHKKQIVLRHYSSGDVSTYERNYESQFESGIEKLWSVPDNYGLIRQASSQKYTAANEQARDLHQYFHTVEQYSLSEYKYIKNTALPMVRDPDPSVSLGSSRNQLQTKLSELETGNSTTVEFTVSNSENGGATSSQGYLSISNSKSLTVTGVEQIAGDQDWTVRNYSAGEDEINYKNGTRATATYDLTDINEPYDPGEANSYKLTIKRVSEKEAWITYRTAFEPLIHDDNSETTFERYPEANNGVSDTDQQNFPAFNVSETTSIENLPPNAQLSSSKTTVTTDDSVTFDSSLSSDDTGINSRTWHVYNTTTDNKITSRTGKQTTITFDSAGPREVELTVTDNTGQSESTSQDVLVTSPPELTATFEANQTVIQPDTVTRFRATTDANSYQWDLDGDGSYDDATGKEATWKPTTTGEYTIGLQVSTDGQQDSVSYVFGVEPAEEILTKPTPVVDAPSRLEVGETGTFDASDSTDQAISGDELVAGSIASYEWDFDSDGQIDATGPAVSNSFDSTGGYSVNLTLIDTAGYTASAQLPVVVESASNESDSDDNTAPTAAFNVTPEVPTVGESVTFSGNESTDIDGIISSYEWDFDGDGTTDATGMTTTHNYTDTGSYDVTLTVTDDSGATSNVTRTVGPVTDPARCSPDVNTDTDLRCIEYGQTKTSQISPSDPESSTVVGIYYEPVRFYGSAGDEVTVTLSSDQLDPLITEVTTPSGETRTNPAGLANPVFGPPYEKSGSFTLNETGEFELRVSHAETYARGSYEMSIDAIKAEPGGLLGSGTPSDPYVITNAADLAKIEDDLNAHYILGSNIDASQTAQLNGDRGLEPVGDTQSAFNGTLDGDGHTIRNLTIHRPEQNTIALFGALGQDGSVRNVSFIETTVVGAYDVGGLVADNAGWIENVSISGFVEGTADVGGIVANNDGQIQNTSSRAEITVENNDGGGIAGTNNGLIQNASSSDAVTRSYTTSSSTLNVGGLVGSNYGTIQHSSASSYVSGSLNTGGLVGSNGGMIQNSSSTGSLSGSDRTGGLVGSNNGQIYNAWAATGDVAGENEVGGLVGSNSGDIRMTYASGLVGGNHGGLVGTNSGSVSDSYWDTETTGQSTSAGGTGLTTAQMTGQAAVSNMTGFDFETTWDTTESYPVLGRTDDESTDGSFDFEVEIQTNATVKQGDNVTITTYPTNRVDQPVSNATLELRVDTNTDGQFTANETVASRSVDFAASEDRKINLTYENVQLNAGAYQFQARLSKNGRTTTSYTNSTLMVEEDSDEGGPSPPGGGVAAPSITFNNSTVSAGRSTVRIDSAFYDEFDATPSYYIVVHERLDNGSLSAPVGNSTAIDAGSASNIPVDIGVQASPSDSLDSLTTNTTLVAMLHTSDSANGTFDDPITVNGSAATDEARITVVDTAPVAPFSKTTALTPNQTTPDSLAGKLRVESAYYASTTDVTILSNSSDEYTMNITVTGGAGDVTFYLQEQAVSSSQNISDVQMLLDGQPQEFTTVESAGPGNSPWLAFTVPDFSTRTVTFTTDTELSVADSIDADNSGRIDDVEILQAIEYWRTKEAVPNTNGETIGDFELLRLIETWRANAAV